MRIRFLLSVFFVVGLTISGQATDDNDQSSSNTSKASYFVFPVNGIGQRSPASPDIWVGGNGNWSDPSKWSAGVPGGNSSVIINAIHVHATLDTSGNIQALVIGGPTGFSLTALNGNRTAQTLGIAGSLTLNQSGELHLESDAFNVDGNVTVAGNPNAPAYLGIDYGSTLHVAGNLQNSGLMQLTGFGSGGDNLIVAGAFTSTTNSQTIIENASDNVSFGTLTNGGELYLQTGATLTLTHQPNGIGTIPQGSIWELHGVITAAGNPAFSSLQTVQGSLSFDNGEAMTITPPNGTLIINNGGSLYSNANLQINGNVVASYRGISGTDISISGWLAIGNGGDAGGTISVARGVTTAAVGSIALLGSDVFTTPTLTNQGFTYLQQASSMVVGAQGDKPSLGPGYHQEANGVLTEQIGKTDYGVVQAPSVFLNGTLNIQLLPGVLPPVGSRYKIVYFMPGELTGQFATVNNLVFNNGTERWMLNYNQSGGYVELMAVQNTGTR